MKANEAYYRACVGEWACRLDFNVEPGAPFHFRLLAWALRLGVPASLHTRVFFDGAVVVHVTSIRVCGVPLVRGVERLTLGDDGASLVLDGAHRMFPLYAPAIRFRGEADVSADALRAVYRIPWMGAMMDQTGERTDEGVTLTQRTPWWSGTQRLTARR